ncbi:hypothetical protein [Pseudoalteromonas sp. Ps84H-4]|uniref:hypothetical protein n=1 Tax=Pseudoalteromonas sp. Ps84H-4 TaxID=2954502 RepID=UPI000C56A5A5|nr:hypothetical protein [Pseudoalteromonas sp. Ps84H-4]MBD55993.1 hypothetical protein [Pseudoalteromonas sp.]MBD57061.1 hypothetical protein [Pseudoalteromonas sp.]MBU75966.1 hypothetical protein [Pseudoalteromonadaceae bacterium]MCO7249373.1 hypothetical protein [Pseudoalteromonas sp. Ps84H-4]
MTRLSSYLLIAMMLLTFVGQSVASVAMVCDMPHASMQMDHHATMSADSDMSDMDCCHEDVMDTSDCACPFNACTAHSLLPLNDLVVKSIKQSEKVTVLGASQLSFRISSLYRPPITA